MIQNSDTSRVNLVERLIASQQELTAVEKFSQRHQSITEPATAEPYRDLIPLSEPGPGEQYAFEIDLDVCSGCKACVAACHSLNGLEEGEIWRNVGLLAGGDDLSPQVQHVTSACHHCLDPGCMSGCPVRAYEKDPVTGIVEHLDDQCIGCKYCMFTCPYDVPSYSPSKGIVRKCNMCVDRLRVNEAPACVQACPNQAISITKVNVEEIQKESIDAFLVPGAPSSELTKPTTRYLSKMAASEGALPVEYYKAKSQHAHFPLVFMLVLTQLALGVFLFACLIGATGQTVNNFFFWQCVSGMALLCTGLGLATMHLGRPDKAYRAMSGFRTSWLSREIIAFNAFAAFASTLLAAFFFAPNWTVPASIATVFFGILAVESSVMLYVVTGRPFWNSARTHGLFFLSAIVSGSAVTIFVLGDANSGFQRSVAVVLIVATIAKLAFESQLLRHRGSTTSTPEQMSCGLIFGEQKNPAIARVALAFFGGVLTPAILLLSGVSGALAVILVSQSLICVVAGELIERYLFFAVSVARRMPGAPNG